MAVLGGRVDNMKMKNIFLPALGVLASKKRGTLKFHILAPLSLVLLFLAVGPAFADTVLVNDYPIAGNNDALTINFGYSVSDQFILGSADTITGVNFGAWLSPGDTFDSVTWTISSGDTYDGLGTIYGSGTASTSLDSSVTPYENSDGDDVASETFSISDLDLSAGTYFLTLDDADTAIGNPAYWDINNVQDVSYESSSGNNASNCNAGQDYDNDPATYTGNCAEAFQILGTSTTTAAPEPSTLSLLVGGMLALGCFRKRLRKSPVS
jgi:hypothetical protein